MSDRDELAALRRMAELEAKERASVTPSVLDAPNAVATGFNRGLVRLAGLPVDTVANVVDLGKAGLGSAYTAVTGKPPPQALELTDRRNVVGSGDYLVDRVGKERDWRAALINPANPEYEGGYLQTAGAGLNALINPNTRAQAVNQAVLGVTGAVGAKAAYDATGNPAYAVTAGLLPSGAQQATVAGTKYAVRGGEAGRQEMERRILALERAGVSNPTLGLASGNAVVGGVENLLQSTPGAVGIMRRSRDAAIAGMQAKAEEAAALSSANRGSLEAGTAIQGGIRAFKEGFKGRQNALYTALEEQLGSQHPTDIVNTRNALSTLNADIRGAPAVGRFFKNERLQALEEALRSDTSGSPESVQVYTRQLPGGGVMNEPRTQQVQVVIPPGPPRDTLPFEAVKKTRTLVGDELADASLMSTVPRSKWRALYGGITEDIGNTARREGPEATRAFNRASDYTRVGMERLERVAPFADAIAPEQAYTAMVNASRENVSTLQAVKKTLPPGARGQVAGTIIERLGTARPGAQNETGTAWSPETFLTNWNRMTPRARQELFSGFPNSAEVKAHVDAIAEATSMMRDSSKMWANPSGTGANVAARATLGAVGLGGAGSIAGLVDPFLIGGAALGLVGTNRLAAGLTNKDVVQAFARRNALSPQQLGTQVIPMFSTGQY
jgi:hypothetical protein